MTQAGRTPGRLAWFAWMAAIGLAVAVAFVAAPASAGAKGGVVLGSKHFIPGPSGLGWGKVKPKRIFNGGVPNGLVSKIHWRGWGKDVAKGHGKGNGYKPGGGYFSKPIDVRLRARGIGHCGGSKRRAYTKLDAQFEKRPGSNRFTDWFAWSGSDSICRYGS